ncbi:hypothetical protein DFH09DRAFT_1319898 [Mycena vulgaris]|nr:hypothetical protein DFH09DRAFT_1319898 [Mycena vulgaris]
MCRLLLSSSPPRAQTCTVLGARSTGMGMELGDYVAFWKTVPTRGTRRRKLKGDWSARTRSRTLGGEEYEDQAYRVNGDAALLCPCASSFRMIWVEDGAGSSGARSTKISRSRWHPIALLCDPIEWFPLSVTGGRVSDLDDGRGAHDAQREGGGEEGEAQQEHGLGGPR